MYILIAITYMNTFVPKMLLFLNDGTDIRNIICHLSDARD